MIQQTTTKIIKAQIAKIKKGVHMSADDLVAEINANAKPSQTIADFIAEAFIPQGIEIPKPESVFKMDNISIFSKKSLSTLIGKAKSGKTTCAAWVAAQLLKNSLKVLWIDTEQGKYYVSRTQHWVLSIYGNVFCNNLSFYDLKIYGPTTRIEIIQLLIEKNQPDLIIIDGIRDLVFDINESKEATKVVQKLMQWAEEFNCHICSILHQNKGNEHARGHLGSEMINKSESVIKVEKDKNQSVTVCTPEFTRGEPFPAFAFERDAAGMPQITNYYSNDTGKESNAKRMLPVQIDSSTHYNCLNRAFGVKVKLQYNELVSCIAVAFQDFGMAMGIQKTKSFISFYTQQGYLTKSERSGRSQYYSIEHKSHLGICTAAKPINDIDLDDEAPF